MNKKKFTVFLQSFVAIPMLAIGAPLAGITPLQATPMAMVQSSNTTVSASTITTPAAQAQLEQDKKQDKKNAVTLDAYFASYDSPLEGYGAKFVAEARKNGIDWRLLPALAMRESTGGKQACKRVANSVFGYGSCKISFKSIDESIERVAASLGGNNPNTVQHYAPGSTTSQILHKYNTVIKGYTNEVQTIMKSIDSTDPLV
jgi:hypothetical protein